MLIERRKYPRVQICYPSEYRGQKVWQYIKTDNLSEGGVFLVTEKVEPVNTQAEILLDFVKLIEERILANGKIAWCREKAFQDSYGKTIPSGIGISFSKFYSPKQRKFVAELVKKQLNRYNSTT